jgi:MtN3 and saliva related transmembrane protein
MNWIIAVGYIAGALNIVCYLPQVLKTWKTKQTRDLSLLTYIVLVVDGALWVLYGFLVMQPPVWVANIIILALTASILYLKMKSG